MLLSVIIPVYNVENFIEECFISLRKQLTDEIEVICINDGSTDGSSVLCDQMAALDSRIKVFHTVNQGVSAARNFGLSHATGEYIAWVDPDDLVAEDWFESIKNAICETNADILVFDYFWKTDRESKVVSYRQNSQKIEKLDFLYDVSEDRVIQSQLWQKVIKRKLFEDIYFPEHIRCMEDYAILHKIILKAKDIFYYAKPIYYYRYRGTSLVNEVDFDKSYNCYKVAVDRYNYLIENEVPFSNIGLLTQAIGTCITYHKLKSNKVAFKDKYNECLALILKNQNEIMKSESIGVRNKIKVILLKMNVFPVALKAHQIIKKIRG